MKNNKLDKFEDFEISNPKAIFGGLDDKEIRKSKLSLPGNGK